MGWGLILFFKFLKQNNYEIGNKICQQSSFTLSVPQKIKQIMRKCHVICNSGLLKKMNLLLTEK